MNDTVVNVGLVLVFVLVGGVFAATEIALVSLREGQIRNLERAGGRGARTAALARNPNRFLSAVQVGVTVAGFLSAAYGASTLAPDLIPTFESWGLPDEAASATALIGTTLVIAYLSLILGELVPKRIALQRTTGVALLTAPTLDRFATAMRPVIWLLSVSTDLLVRLLGGDPKAKNEAITHEELRDLVIGHAAIAESERRILAEVFDAGHRTLIEVMRPRTDVDFLPADTLLTRAREQALASGHSRYPVTGASFDDIAGFVHLRDLLLADPHTVTTVADLCRPVLQLPASKPALAALTEMRRDNLQIAIVVDEYGGTAGIVTRGHRGGDRRRDRRRVRRTRPTCRRRSGAAPDPSAGGRATDRRGLRDCNRSHPARGTLRNRGRLPPPYPAAGAPARRHRHHRRHQAHRQRSRRPPHRSRPRHPSPPRPGCCEHPHRAAPAMSPATLGYRRSAAPTRPAVSATGARTGDTSPVAKGRKGCQQLM